MKMKLGFAAALLAATMLSGAANAKTFVYCSEASPEGFDPGLYESPPQDAPATPGQGEADPGGGAEAPTG